MNDIPTMTYAEAQPKKHSGMGITSFVISIVVGCVEIILVTVAGFTEASTPGGMDEESPQAIMLGLGIIGGLFLCLVGIGLGIAGVVPKDRMKLFAILGLVFNCSILLCVVCLVLLGLAIR